jgi:hypothetical protein
MTNPLPGLPVPPYIVVAKVTTVTRDQETPATLQTGLGDDGQTIDLAPDCPRWDSISLYLVLLGLCHYLYEVRAVLVTVGVGNPPLCTLPPYSASMLGCFLP